MNAEVKDAVVAAVWCFIFSGIFGMAWSLNLRYGEHTFETFSLLDKVEWCRRTCSTLHASIVVPGVVMCLIRTSVSGENVAFYAPPLCRLVFNVSVGYFVMDAVLAAYWRVRCWRATVAYNLLAVAPLAVNNFVPSCHCGGAVLALFLLVEVPTLRLNLLGALDHPSKAAAAAARRSALGFGACASFYALWFLARVLLPTYALGLLYDVVLPAWYEERSAGDMWRCVLPGAASANVVAFFSFYAFFSSLSADIFCRRLGWWGGSGDVLRRGGGGSGGSRGSGSGGGAWASKRQRRLGAVAGYGSLDGGEEEWLTGSQHQKGGAGFGGASSCGSRDAAGGNDGGGGGCGGCVSDGSIGDGGGSREDYEDDDDDSDDATMSHSVRLLGKPAARGDAAPWDQRRIYV